MTVTVTCQCGAKFSLTHRFQNQGQFVCPNCGVPLNDEDSECIKKLLKAYLDICQGLAEGYDMEINT